MGPTLCLENHVDTKKGAAKNMFCDKMQHFQSNSTYLQVSCLGQLCIVINKNDGDRCGAFKDSQETIGGILHEKELAMGGGKKLKCDGPRNGP